MSNSFRIRTQPGVDKSLNVLIEQEFEYLEILSLKILQSQIYTRQCSDYGVIVGRVSVNDGFGVPNAKVSVFIPLDSEDELNPIISDLYPYKTLTDINEDGYRYNLLPYKQSHSGHNPTGTFFTRENVLTDPTLINVYDKYYKYTTVTNSSGDYMIFGVPTGSQTVVIDIDLSDIGEFSLSPQDLIRMGITTESQVSGTSFKSSTNLNSLPQIININRIIEVEPLWGQSDICNLGITRTDFDLTKEANIEVRPTSIFMGSIISTNNNEILPRNCKPRVKSGSLCSLVTGPGEILAIRQTIFQDDQGRPVLETVDLDEGGQVINEDGTWMVDVPMNLDYVITNEFGEQVISDDPTKGIPTKGKYRFKVKWNQSPSLSQTTRRGYFLVPNIREYGWEDKNEDPTSTGVGLDILKKSYSFSLNWDDYADFQSAIDCEDTFYLMQYNKVYTVSQLIDQYRKGYLNNQFIGIKNILDESCESDNNKFPTNDGVFRFDLIYFLFWIMLFLFRPIFFVLIPVIHILWFVLKILSLVLSVIYAVIMVIVSIICNIIKPLVRALSRLPGGLGRFFRRLNNQIKCPKFSDIKKNIESINEFPDKLTNIKIPNLSYPQCEFCDCGDNNNLPNEVTNVEQLQVDEVENNFIEIAGTSILTPFELFGEYLNSITLTGETGNPNIYTTESVYQTLFAGNAIGDSVEGVLLTSTRVPGLIISSSDDENPESEPTDSDPEFAYFTSSLNLPERLNLFNTKAKYFNEGPSNPGGGVNRIKVTFQPDLNNPDLFFHYDNVVAMVCNPNASNLSSGTMLTFHDINLSKDINVFNDSLILNDYGTNTITGETINVGTISSPANITINFSNPNGSGDNSVSYNIVSSESDALYAKFPTDVEYYQVITGMTYQDYVNLCNNGSVSIPGDWNNLNSFNNRFLSNTMRFYRITIPQINEFVSVTYNCGKNLTWSVSNRDFRPIDYYNGFESQRVVFLVRGVDPNSTRTKVRYDISRLFGFNFNGGPIIEGDNFKLNHPIQGGFNCVNHNSPNNIVADYYYDSFHFRPAQTGPFSFSSFTTNLHTYYSNLDTTNGSFSPGPGAPVLSSVTQPLSLVSRVVNTYLNNTPPPIISPSTIGTQGWNGFIVEWDILFDYPIDCTYLGSPIINLYNRRGGSVNSTTLFDNRGYYPSEIIEGGSMFYQKLDINQTNGDSPVLLENHYYAPKYPDTLLLTIDVINTFPDKIVMRSDRLPTSTSIQNNLNNSFPLHTNNLFSIYIITDDGIAINQAVLPTGSSSIFSGETEEYSSSEIDSDNPAVVNQVVESFNCGNMAPLGCYYNSGNNILIKPKSDDCWKFANSGKVKFDGGCYILITDPIISLLNLSDFKVVAEWSSRVQTMFGVCRNVFSHLFTNNWINGTLYAFTFSNDVEFSNTSNKPRNRFCKDTMFFDDSTNNFYYRSSPWKSSTSEFIGSKRPEPNGGITFGGYGGNFNNLKFPTTIMDLGPRNIYIQELVMSDEFDGYVMDKFNSTTYGDVSDLLNMFVVTRLANESFLLGLSGLGILTFFSRNRMMVDGDYSQMISINSELAVAQFQSINYPDSTTGGDNPVYYSSDSINDVVFGVFFSSDTQTRDFISPKRTIINPEVSVGSECSFNNFSVFTQIVPMYQWEIKGSDTQSIFGSQNNTWKSSPIYNETGFFSYPYQLLDRTNPDSRYMRTNGNFETQYFKGHIYSVDVDGNLDSDFSSLSPNTINNRLFTTGAPFHFYFGLKNGRSAFDRFTTKWINTETTL